MPDEAKHSTSAAIGFGELTQAMDTAAVGTWSLDFANDHAEWNRATQTLLGLPPDAERTCENLVAAIHPDDVQRLHEAVGEQSESFSIEFRVIWPDQSVHWLATKGRRFLGETGEVTRMVGIVFCITAQKQFERDRETLLAERERQEEFLRRLFDNAPIGIAVIDRNGRYVLANPSYEGNVGRPVPHFPGHHVGEFAPPELAKFMNQLLQRVLATAQPVVVRELEANLGPGREHTWWDNDVVPLLDRSGSVDSILALTKEVTERVQARKQIEELLRKMEDTLTRMKEFERQIEQLARFAEESPNPVLRICANQVLKYANASARPILTEWDCQVGQVVPPAIQETVIQALREGAVVEREFQLSSGRFFLIAFSPGPSREDINVYGRDITERKHWEQELQRVSGDLARSNRDLEHFAHIASHDLQEPLRMVSGHLHIVSDRTQGKLDDAAEKSLHFAVDGAVRMQALIRELLTYSRAGAVELEPQWVDMHAAVGQAVENLSAVVRESGAAMHVDPLPTVYADETQMVQLLQNLLSNAIKYRREDGPPEINVSARFEGGSWRFQIGDNGIGIDPQHVERIFDPFRRLHAKSKYPGTGMGLAICKRIVERHRGMIGAESELGKGSTFWFTIPVRPANDR